MIGVKNPQIISIDGYYAIDPANILRGLKVTPVTWYEDDGETDEHGLSVRYDVIRTKTLNIGVMDVEFRGESICFSLPFITKVAWVHNQYCHRVNDFAKELVSRFKKIYWSEKTEKNMESAVALVQAIFKEVEYVGFWDRY